jgi:hypothetical protein
MWHCVVWYKVTNVSQDSAASIFKVENLTIPLGWRWMQQVPPTCTFWYHQLQDYTAVTSCKTVIFPVTHIHFTISHIPLPSSMQFQHTFAWPLRTQFHKLKIQHPLEMWLTATKSMMLWVVTPHTSERAQHLERNYHLHLSGQSES